jgi:hypothetical protein
MPVESVTVVWLVGSRLLAKGRIQHCTSDVGNGATAWKAEDLLNCP